MLRSIFWCLIVLAAVPASADLVVWIEPGNGLVAPGTSSSLEVLVMNASPFLPVTIDYFTLGVDAGASGVMFDGVDGTGLRHPYALPSGDGPVPISALPSASGISYGDQYWNVWSMFVHGDPILPGEVKSLGRVLFTADMHASGTVPITLSGSTQFLDHDPHSHIGVISYAVAASPGPGNLLGSINITATGIPEPSSLILL